MTRARKGLTRAMFAAAAIALAAPALAQERLPIGTHVGSGTAPFGSASSTYTEYGRRDPFVTLLAPKKTAGAAPVRPVFGLAGVAVSDVAVKGIIRNGATMVAVLEGPAGKSFMARSKDRLQDGSVKSIDADGVVFVERVVDALGAVHARDVRKTLRLNAEGDQ